MLGQVWKLELGYELQFKEPEWMLELLTEKKQNLKVQRLEPKLELELGHELQLELGE